MKAMVLDANGPIEGSPLKLLDVPAPQALRDLKADRLQGSAVLVVE